MERMQWRKMMAIALPVMLAIASACDDDDGDTKSNLNPQDRDFVVQASYANRAEVELGALAVSKGNQDAVKMFGNMMREEHQNAWDNLRNIAAEVEADFPSGLKGEHQALKDRLMSLSGYAFDTAYIHSQVKGHQEAEALFETEVRSGKELRLKDYATDLLPHIRMHLQMADSLAATLAVPARGN
ncbi:MAG TPA: DUF4142 domain-containing protein [Ohtaekwangia sp.]